eukprot:8708120-Pyramimonas_sp.AAC.1
MPQGASGDLQYRGPGGPRGRAASRHVKSGPYRDLQFMAVPSNAARFGSKSIPARLGSVQNW